MSGNNMSINEILDLHQKGMLTQAELGYVELLKQQPNHAQALNFYGYLLVQTQRHDQALPYIEKSLKIDANIAQYFSVYGLALSHCGLFERAAQAFIQGAKVEPSNAQNWHQAAQCYRKIGEYPAEILCLENQIKLHPKDANAQHNLAIALQKNGQYEQSLSSYLKAQQLDPSNSWIQYNLAVLLQAMGNYEKSLESFEQSLRLNPDHIDARNRQYFLKRLICQWDNIDNEKKFLEEKLKHWCEEPDYQTVSPFNLNILGMSQKIHHQVARIYADMFKQRAGLPLKNTQETKQSSRIRIGYLSADFRNHAVGTLIYRLFGSHDKTCFEVYCFSLLKADDIYQKTIQNDVETFIDIQSLNFRESAQLIAEKNIDILIDLGGYTQHSRTEILALKPAKIQISYMGYLNTMGADFIDYIIADSYVISNENKPYYDEKILCLNQFFMGISPQPFEIESQQKAVWGLPENSFVFCCFNTAYKLNNQLLDCWSEILHETKNSCLWLYSGHYFPTRKNLVKEFENRGIQAQRIVFAKNETPQKHLSRLALADLFLDAFDYNAGATALNAMQMNLPILSLQGKNFLSRMSASMNHHLGLDELICTSTQEYIQKAKYYYEHPEQLQSIVHKMKTNKKTNAICDTQQWAGNLENLYREVLSTANI